MTNFNDKKYIIFYTYFFKSKIISIVYYCMYCYDVIYNPNDYTIHKQI